MKNTPAFNIPSTISRIILSVGAAMSLILMFNAGRNQKSVLLIIFFTVWVAFPFIVLLIADRFFKRWSIPARYLYFLIIFISLGSMIIYYISWTPPGTKTAFKFLIVPLISVLLIVIVLGILRRKFQNVR